MTGAALSGHTVIVTGACGGIGAAVSCALSRAGAGVVLAARDGRAIEGLAADLRSAGGHAVAVPTDITNPVSVRRLVEQTLGAFGRLDAAVNARVHGAELAMRYQIPSMRRARGRVVNLAPTADTRAAVAELTRMAASGCVDSGVRINAVAVGLPGSTEEVAAAVVWLCSTTAPPATGETLDVPTGRPLWTHDGSADRLRGVP